MKYRLIIKVFILMLISNLAYSQEIIVEDSVKISLVERDGNQFLELEYSYLDPEITVNSYFVDSLMIFVGTDSSANDIFEFGGRIQSLNNICAPYPEFQDFNLQNLTCFEYENSLYRMSYEIQLPSDIPTEFVVTVFQKSNNTTERKRFFFFDLITSF